MKIGIDYIISGMKFHAEADTSAGAYEYCRAMVRQARACMPDECIDVELSAIMENLVSICGGNTIKVEKDYFSIYRMEGRTVQPRPTEESEEVKNQHRKLEDIPKNAVVVYGNEVIALIREGEFKFSPLCKILTYKDPFPTAKKIEVCLQDEEVKPYE